jgi:hypothetical protein
VSVHQWKIRGQVEPKLGLVAAMSVLSGLTGALAYEFSLGVVIAAWPSQDSGVWLF